MDGDSHNLNFDEPGKGFEESELPVSAFKMWVSLGKVGHLHFLGIPVEALSRELAGYHTKA